MKDQSRTKQELLEENAFLKQNIQELEHSESGRKIAEAALRKSEKRFRELAELLPETVYETDMQGILTFVNRNAFDLFGFTQDDFTGGLNALDMVIPDDRGRALKNLQRILNGENIGSIEYTVRRKDGSTFPAIIHSTVIIHDGKPAGLRGFIIDITEQKRAEGRLTKINACLLALGPDFDENVARLTALCGELLGATCALYNRLESGMLYSIGQWHTPPDYAAGDKPDGHICYDVIRQGSDEVLVVRNLSQTPYAATDLNVTKYGLRTYFGQVVRCAGEPVGSLCVVFQRDVEPTDDDKRILGIIASSLTSEEGRKRVEESLRKNRKQLTDIIDFLPDATFAIDKERRVIIWNKAIEKMTGITAAEMIGQGDYAYTIPFYGKARPQLMDLVFEHQEEIAARYPYITREGDTLITEVFCNALNNNKGAWVFAKASPLHDQAGNIIGAIESIRDITERKRAEEALMASEMNYRDIFNAINDAIVIHDMEASAILDVNSIMEKMWGYTREEAMRIDVGALSQGEPPYSQQDAKCWVRKAATEGPQVFEWLARRKNGELFWLEVKLQAVVIAGRRRIMAVDRDITERKRAEKALEKSAAQLRTLIDTIPDLVWLKDPAGVYLECNRRFEQFFGAKKKDIIGKTDYDFVDRELADFFRENDRKAMAARKPITNEEEVAYADDGHREILETIKAPIFGVSGEILGVLGIGRDITERKRTEEDLRESEARLREAQSIAHLGNLELDLLTKTLTWSDETFRIFEIDKDCFSASYEEFMAAIHPEDRNAVNAAYTQSLETRKPFVFSHRLLMRDGRIKWVQVQCVTHYNPEGKPLRSVGTVQDITVQKHLEEQHRKAQKMEAIGQLAGGIAHDFNNILSAIIGFTEVSIRDVPPGSKLEDNLQRVLKAGLRARDLIKQILTFSRQTDRVVKPVQLKPIAKEALKLIRASLPATIEIHQDIGSGSLILGDPTQIHQIIMNLCTNAAHAMQDIGGRMVVSLTDVELGADVTDPHPDMVPGPFIKLTVSDSGRGIAPEIRDRIFDPFFTTKRQEEGTGLGLSVVHGIVKDCGGMVSVESMPGKGSTFNVFFPVIENEQGSEIVAQVPLPTGNERILFVDDEEQQVEMGKQVLELLGYRVTTKTGGMEALNVFREKPDEFDLVVTDLTMPKMTGDVLAKEIMAIRSDVPVILCTGYSEKITPAKAKTLGIKEVIMKPALVEEIARTVRMVLDQPFKK